MDALSPETLHRLERNDDSVTFLKLGHAHNSIGADHFTRLGAAIAKSSHLKELEVDVYRSALKDTEVDLFDGIKQNSSIQRLNIICGSRNIVGTSAHEILKACHGNNNLIRLNIQHAGLQNGGDLVIANTLMCCTKLKYIKLSCDINDEHMLPLVEALRDSSLEDLDLGRNRIGSVGCNALASLLRDPNNNLHTLDLSYNQIGDDGAVAIANSLATNTKLKTLLIHQNRFNDQSDVIDILSKVLCDTSSISATYTSNHTLRQISFHFRTKPHLLTLLLLNQGTNKSHVAIKKISEYHPNIDMEPLFELDEGRERTLKGLPLIIDWFERAKEAVVNDRDSYYYQVEEKKLSAIYQFAQAMPELFIPTDTKAY